MTAQVLATGFARKGAKVTVVTHTEREGEIQLPFRVLREPSPLELYRAVKDSDVVLHNNPAMRFAWPSWVTRTPLVIAVRQYVTVPGKRLSAKARLLYHAKYFAIESADELIANSDAIGRHLRSISNVIPNSYRDSVFHIDNDAPRPRGSLAFLGRLTPDKGADLPITALAGLVRTGHDAYLVIMGDGPHRPELEALAASLGVRERVKFMGSVDGTTANRVLNQSAIAIVPSRQPESFGTVALEEAGSGCVVVGSNDGGLVQAIGPCGPLFTPGDAADLERVLTKLIEDDELFESYRSELKAHTDQHTEQFMVDGYYDVLARVAREGGRNPRRGSLVKLVRRLVHPGPPEGF